MNQMATENESDRVDMQDQWKNEMCSNEKNIMRKKATHSDMLQHSNWFGSQ